MAIVLFTMLAAHASGADCAQSDIDMNPVYVDGWGLEPGNTRFQPNTSITRANVGGLVLEWAVSLGKKGDHHSMPLVAGNTVFVGTEEGVLLALDRETGCQRYIRQFDSNIRTAIIPHTTMYRGSRETLLYFGTDKGSVYAVKSRNGDVAWHAAADVHSHTRMTGTPAIAGDTIYIPVSSVEAAVAAGPTYSCCTFRGSILALDAATGERKWRSYTIDEPARITGTRLLVIKERGPSGAPVWSTPTVDERRGVLYYGTGENYSLPATATSDAIVSIALADGSRNWSSQFTANDVWNMSCELPLISANCPDEANGVDLDFGAPPILTAARGRGGLLVAGQKSGVIYGIDPDSGSTLWERRAGRGGKLGGVHWGMAADAARNLVYVPISDRVATGSGADPARPGLHAIDLDSGEIVWSTLHAEGCSDDGSCDSGLSAAVMATSELVFAGGLDGQLRAYDAPTGEVLWSFQTAREFRGVDGEPVSGGSIDVHGPVVAGDMVYVTSGYGVFMQKSGNAFLAFRVANNEGTE